MEYYCVCDGSNRVYGVGLTEDSAEQDSLKHIDGTIEQSGLWTMRCPKEVYDAFVKHFEKDLIIY